MDDEYPRGPRKQYKHSLKGEDQNHILRKWLKEAKPLLLNAEINKLHKTLKKIQAGSYK